MSDSDQDIRLSKHLSQTGQCSRREADKLIEQGLVLVNGNPAVLGQKVSPSDKVEILDKGSKQLASKATIALHKPVGYVSAQAEDGYKPAIEILSKSTLEPDRKNKWTPKIKEGLAPAGRLDIDSKGLLIMTQDGVVAKAIIGAESKMEKEYVVKVKGDVSEEKLKKLRHGLELDGKPLKPAKVNILRDTLLNIVLTEGKKRQIRRMCEAVGFEVLMLKRVRIGPIRLGELKEGRWRFLSDEEVARIKTFI